MRSKAHIKSHPIHPMLVAFPIAFLYGALGFDAAGRIAGWPGGWATGAYLSLAAIAAGLVAAVPGVIDYLYAVPPDSSARARATQHMLINISALAAFAAGWAFRDRATLLPGPGTLLLEAAGAGLVTWGGWLGGTLVYRNQIGVDHRYAGAGKWKEMAVEGRADGPIAVAGEGELEVGHMKLLHVGDRRIVLARTERGYAAFDDRCPHKGGPLSDGALICGAVQCPWHGSQFDVHTGAVKAGPAGDPIGTYRVEVADGEARLSVADAAASPPGPGRAIPHGSWIVLALCLLPSCSHDRGGGQAALGVGGKEISMSIKLQSDAFDDGRPIPRRYGEDGEDLSPPLTWSGLPEGTRELALIVDDPDAPRAEPWVHWVLYKVPADVRTLTEGLPRTPTLSAPPGAMQGKNSWGTDGYRGPAPPKGHGTHHYHFRLYALDAPLAAAQGLDKAGLLEAMQGHVLAEGELVGTYER